MVSHNCKCCKCWLRTAVVEGECQQRGGVLVQAKPVVVVHVYVWCAEQSGQVRERPRTAAMRWMRAWVKHGQNDGVMWQWGLCYSVLGVGVGEQMSCSVLSAE